MRLDQLQDIDELQVVEVSSPCRAAPAASSAGRGGGNHRGARCPAHCSTPARARARARTPHAFTQAAAPRNSGASTSGGAAAAANGYLQHHRVATADAEITAADSDGDDSKYARRNSALQRTMRRVFPSLFQASSLPVTSK